MKRILLVLPLALCAVVASAQTLGGQKNTVQPSISNPINLHSARITPKVYPAQSYTQLSVKFYAPSDSYDLIVEDQGGGVVCQWALMTDGAFYFYSLPNGLPL